MDKRRKREKRKKRIRGTLSGSAERPRLAIFRSNKNIYVQLIDDAKGTTLIGLSGSSYKKGENITTETSGLLGEELAKKAQAKKIKSIVFDRSGYKYHGVVKAVAEGARKAGLKF